MEEITKARRPRRHPELRAYVAAHCDQSARRGLLALAFLRGVPYRVLEPVTGEAKSYAGCPSEAWRAELHASWRRHMAQGISRLLAELGLAAVDPALLVAWLAVPEESARAEARAKARAAWLARGRALRDEHAARRAGAAA